MTDPADVRRPWLPAGVPIALEDTSTYAYVVVDEKVGDHMGLTVTHWPDADGYGRLRFHDQHEGLELAVSYTQLEKYLKTLDSKRRPHIGDVFAVQLSEAGWALVARGDEQELQQPI